MGIFPILGVERKDERQPQFCGLACSRLPQQDWMMGVNHVQLEDGEQLIHKR